MNPPDLPAASLAMLGMWFDIAPDAMLAVDRQGVIVLANAQAERMFGYAHEALRGLALEALVPESLRNAHRMHRHDYMARPRTRPMGIGYELMGVKHDGQAFPLEIGLSSIATEKGVIAIASVRDISETRRVRQALERARRDSYVASISRLALESPDYELAIRRILELTAVALELPAAAILATDWRRSAFHIRASTGLSEQTAQTITSIFGDADAIRGAFDARERTMITSDMLRQGPSAAIAADLARAGFGDVALSPLHGRHETLGFLLALATAPGSFDEGKVNFLQSIASLLASAVQRSRTEEQLAHTQRLDAIGKLAGGIAHDFNNLLTVITANLGLVEERVKDETTRQQVEQAVKAAQLGANFNKRLLSLAGSHQYEPQRFELNARVADIVDLLRHALGEQFVLSTRLATDLWPVNVDPIEVDSALLNLALNARDAMPHGGEITFTTGNVTLDASRAAAIPDAKPGDYVCVEVVDNGEGMAEDVLKHATEAFFSKKENNFGTGLGLFSVQAFVRRADGLLVLRSKPGAGTTVSIYLPKTAAAAAPQPVVPNRMLVPRGNGELVLVVEDDDSVRDVAKRLLRMLGYAVVEAGTAAEAIGLLKPEAGIHLVFRDVVMPGKMSGAELAHWVHTNRPGMKVLLTSGYNADVASGHDATPAGVKMLPKPYTSAQLARAVREALESA